MATLNEATRAFIAARETVEQAQKALANAEVQMKEAFTRTGVDTNIVDGKKVILVRSEREKFDASTLAELVNQTTFAKVTKVEVDTKQFRAAVELGDIPSTVKAAVTSVTEVEAVRVYDIAGEAVGTQGAAVVSIVAA
jgi:hypothetical protein